MENTLLPFIHKHGAPNGIYPAKTMAMSKKIVLLLFYFCLLQLRIQAQYGNTTLSAQAAQYFKEAEAALLRHDYKQAVKGFERALKIHPGLSAANKGLAACYELMKDYAKAVIYYEKIVASDSMYSRAIYYQLGEAHYKIGHYDKALSYFRQYETLLNKPADAFGLHGEREMKAELKYVEKLPVNIKASEVSLDSLKFLNITDVINLGAAINTSADEYFPFLSNDQQLIYYTHRKSGKDEDLYHSRIVEGRWRKGEPVKNFNTAENEGMSTMVRDGRRMYFTACAREGVMGTCDIWMAELDTLQTMQNLESAAGMVNSDFWESQASISCDGSVLYFSSNRKGGLGGADLWYCLRGSDGRWGAPINLGPKINTPEDEEAPFITNDGKTLYFSSTGHLGLGEQDIFMSWFDERLKEWTTPINLGPPVNTPYRELGFFLSADGATGYVASDQPGGQGGMDIYRFRLSDKLFGDPITFVEGYLRDSVLMTPVEAKVEIAGRGAVQTGPDGRFFLCIGADETLKLGVQKRGYKPYANQFVIPEWNNRTYYTLDLLLQPTISFIANIPPAIPVDSAQIKADKNKINRTYTHTVFFEFDKYSIEAPELARLDEFAKSFKNKKIQRVEIIGFSDDIGAEAYNLRLSEERAKGIALFLVQNNIVVDQIYMEGKGELEGKNNKELNRKVEVRVMTLE